eukprot:145169_1
MSNDSSILSTLRSAGFGGSKKIFDTLQGNVWRSIHKATRKRVVVKVASRSLHRKNLGVVEEGKVKVHENIKKENIILRYLTNDHKCHHSIINYVFSFASPQNYFLVMGDGGHSVFDLVTKAHAFINSGRLEMAEWHKLVKIIFKQMIASIEYIHKKNVCHFDISLENFLVNNISCILRTRSGDDKPNKLKFCVADDAKVHIRLCDFGLAEIFTNTKGLDGIASFESNKYCGKSIYQSPEVSSRKASFSAQKNDVWCLGTCFFMMIVGGCPWKRTKPSDEAFNMIMNGQILDLLCSWDKLYHVDKYIVHLFMLFFQYEAKRITIDELKRCQWLLA